MEDAYQSPHRSTQHHPVVRLNQTNHLVALRRHIPGLYIPSLSNMTDSPALTRHSTPTDIYTVCTSYQQLSQHRSLRSAKNLLRCINAYNNTHHIYNTSLAFDQHRSLTLSGQIHKRARLFVAQPILPTHSASSSSRVTEPSPLAASHDDEIHRLVYEQQITLSMHSSSLKIDRRMFTQKRLVCDQTLDLVLHSCNKAQGPSGCVLFISSLVLQAEMDIHRTTVVDGRSPTDCQTLVKAVNVDKRHWIAAVWHRQTPGVVYTLDSLSHKSQLALLPLRPFIALCHSLACPATPVGITAETAQTAATTAVLATTTSTNITLEAVAVPKQNDSTSCGLFVAEFCRVLCAADADITTGATRVRLQQIETKQTREWLGRLCRTLDVPLSDPCYKRSTHKRQQSHTETYRTVEDAVVIDH